jgi:hypothetical protein
VTALLAHTDDLLRGGPLTTRPARPRRLLLRLLAIATVGGLIYGGVMGAYGGVAHGRAWQMVYSAVKVPLLLLATFALSLPSFFVLNQLLGVGRDFPVVLRGLVATQAALTVVLASLAPLTALWYATSADYGTALAANMVAFTVAAVAAQAVLQRGCWCTPSSASRWAGRSARSSATPADRRASCATPRGATRTWRWGVSCWGWRGGCRVSYRSAIACSETISKPPSRCLRYSEDPDRTPVDPALRSISETGLDDRCGF